MTAAPSGLQWERTRLAWRRTVLTATVVALLGLRLALLADLVWVRALATAGVMLIWLGAVVVGHHRIAGLTRGAQWPGRTPAFSAVVTLGLAAVGLALLV